MFYSTVHVLSEFFYSFVTVLRSVLRVFHSLFPFCGLSGNLAWLKPDCLFLPIIIIIMLLITSVHEITPLRLEDQLFWVNQTQKHILKLEKSLTHIAWAFIILIIYCRLSHDHIFKGCLESVRVYMYIGCPGNTVYIQKKIWKGHFYGGSKWWSDTMMHINLDKRPDYFFWEGIFQEVHNRSQGGAQKVCSARVSAPNMHPLGWTSSTPLQPTQSTHFYTVVINRTF